MWKRALLLISVILYAHSVSCADVYLIPAEAEYCAFQGCDFTNASLWSTGTVPTSSDIAHLIAGPNSSDIRVEIRSDVTVAALVAEKVHITVITGANLTVVNATEIDNAELIIYGNLQTVDMNLIAANASVHGGLYVFAMDYMGFNLIDDLSQLWVWGTYRTDVHTTIRGQVVTAAQSEFLALGDTILFNPNCQFANEPHFSELWVASDVNATFVGGLSANELALASGTTVTVNRHVGIQTRVTFLDATARLCLTDVGHVEGLNSSYIGQTAPDSISTVAGGELIIQSSNVTIENSGQSTINATISVADGVSYINLVHVTVNENTKFTISPSASIRWGLTGVTFDAQASLTGDATLYGPIVVNHPVEFYKSDFVALVAGELTVTNTTFTTQRLTIGSSTEAIVDTAALLQVPDVFIEEGGMLSAGSNWGYRNGEYAPVVVTGTITNAGKLVVSQVNQLKIYGDYVQYPNATLRVVLDHPSHPTDANATATALWVQGETHLNTGYLEIIVKILKPDANFQLIQSEGNVTGEFHTVTVDNSAVASRSLGKFDVKYENNQVVLVFTPAPEDSDDSDDFWDTPWPGVIFGVGGAIIVAIIVFFLVRRYRKKKQYQAIP